MQSIVKRQGQRNDGNDITFPDDMEAFSNKFQIWVTNFFIDRKPNSRKFDKERLQLTLARPGTSKRFLDAIVVYESETSFELNKMTLWHTRTTIVVIRANIAA